MVDLIALRRDLHAHPELSFAEHKTAQRLQKELENAGYKVTSGIAATGLIADLGSAPVVAIRSDMDGLPINELNNAVYRSRSSGVMHACGHDVHMACVIGAAVILAEAGVNGIRIIMQPGEEDADQESRGSRQMIAADAMKDVQAILGLHVDATMPAGRVGVVTQPIHASLCQFELSYDDQSPANLISRSSRLMAKLVSIGEQIKLRQGQLEISELRMRNFAPSPGLLVTGSIGYPSTEVAQAGIKMIREAASQIMNDSEFKLTANMNEELHTRHGEVIETLYSAACAIVGEENVARVARKTWAGNFGDFTRYAPGAFLLLGTELRGDRRIQHTATFDINEEALAVGAQVLAEAARQLCAKRA